MRKASCGLRIVETKLLDYTVLHNKSDFCFLNTETDVDDKTCKAGNFPFSDLKNNISIFFEFTLFCKDISNSDYISDFLLFHALETTSI